MLNEYKMIFICIVKIEIVAKGRVEFWTAKI